MVVKKSVEWKQGMTPHWRGLVLCGCVCVCVWFAAWTGCRVVVAVHVCVGCYLIMVGYLRSCLHSAVYGCKPHVEKNCGVNSFPSSTPQLVLYYMYVIKAGEWNLGTRLQKEKSVEWKQGMRPGLESTGVIVSIASLFGLIGYYATTRPFTKSYAVPIWFFSLK